MHNTEGPKCDRCKVGFYGDPTRGTPDDCRPCECPLGVDSNNFSPTCRLGGVSSAFIDNGADAYTCTACPRAYSGSRCERCADGYFGNPLKPGDFCRPCECNGNSGDCDKRTGECLNCEGNTSGWKCDECAVGFFGDPFSGSCRACDCDAYGSLDVSDCDKATGQCLCKAKYVSRTCGQCEDGFGNLKVRKNDIVSLWA